MVGIVGIGMAVVIGGAHLIGDMIDSCGSRVIRGVHLMGDQVNSSERGDKG